MCSCFALEISIAFFTINNQIDSDFLYMAIYNIIKHAVLLCQNTVRLEYCIKCLQCVTLLS